MEPLSITASVVGLLAATAKVSKVLTKFINGTKRAPKLAENVLIQVSDINAILAQLRTFVKHTNSASPSRKRMLMLNQVVVTLTHSVIVISDLESIVNSLDVANLNRSWARVAWARQESRINTILERLQWSKTSLTLMLSTLTCDSVGEAASAVESLTNLVQQVLRSNEDLASRLSNLESSSNRYIRSSLITQGGHTGDDVQTITPRARLSLATIPEKVRSINFAFEFDHDLYQSWVYTRAMQRRSLESLPSSATKSFAWSCLSDWSLDQVTNLSVISLPITRDSVSNVDHYDFAQSPTTYSNVSEPSSGHRLRNRPSWAPSIYSQEAYSQGLFGPDNDRRHIVLLGIQHSGKTTFRKQMNFLHGYELLDEERRKYRGIILQNILEALVSTQCDILESDVELTAKEIKKMRTIRDLTKFLNLTHLEDPTPYLVNRGAVKAARVLASNPVIRKNIALQDKMGINANIEKSENFLSKLDALSAESFLASDADVLHARQSTKYWWSSVNFDFVYYRIIDLGGAPSERLSWSKHIPHATFIIFTVALTGYCQFIPENGGVSDIEESWKQFESLVRCTSAPITLFFTKLDMLEKRLKRFPFSHYFPMLGRPLPHYLQQEVSCVSVCQFLADAFTDCHTRVSGELYIYFASTVDTPSFERTFWDIRADVLSRRKHYKYKGRSGRRQSPIEALKRLDASRPDTYHSSADQISKPTSDQDENLTDLLSLYQESDPSRDRKTELGGSRRVVNISGSN